ncbi:MAG: signal peptidase II [Candidatus Schekmanbacteria bacterium]|nr:signal peptidase II [Candidatus Schekmanbacteria bacterium]
MALAVLGLVGIDQATKLLVQQSFVLGEHRPIIAGCFDLTYTLNPGAAFGFLKDSSATLRVPFFFIVSTLALGVLAYLAASSPAGATLYRASLVLLASGAIGNLIDRIRLGEVVDFILLYYRDYRWPAFNVADSAITVGVAALIIDVLRKPVRVDGVGGAAESGVSSGT